jgi:hypothetical protein
LSADIRTRRAGSCALRAKWLVTVLMRRDLPPHEKRWILRHTPASLDRDTSRRLHAMLDETSGVVERCERIIRLLERC